MKTAIRGYLVSVERYEYGDKRVYTVTRISDSAEVATIRDSYSTSGSEGGYHQWSSKLTVNGEVVSDQYSRGFGRRRRSDALRRRRDETQAHFDKLRAILIPVVA